MRHKNHKAKSTRRGRFNVPTRVGAFCLLSTTFLIPISPAAGGMAEGLAAYRAGDYVTAHAEWLPLAREGAAAAQRNLGQLYRLGQGVPRNAAVAVNWYRLAAEQGLARAQSNLAAMYLQGDGIEKNPAIAADWLRQAAAQGHALSQFNLGLMYESGFGVDLSLVKARSWYELAASAGNAKARERLENLRDVPAKDDVALLPPNRKTMAPKAATPDTGAERLKSAPINPDAARQAALTRVRVALAQVLRERAAQAAQGDKTVLPLPPFARAEARAEQRRAETSRADQGVPKTAPAFLRPAEIVRAETALTEIMQAETARTEITQADIDQSRAKRVRKPVPGFLRQEARGDTGGPQFKPLPRFLVAEARRDKPVPDFLRQEARNDTGAPRFKPLPRFLVAEAHRDKPAPDFLRQEARDDMGAPQFKPLPRFLVAEAQLTETGPDTLRRDALRDAGALKLKPLPRFLANEAWQDRRQIILAAMALPTKRAVVQETLPPLPGRQTIKPIPEFLKREAQASVVASAAGLPAHKPLPPARQVAGVDLLPVPLPTFLEEEAREDRSQQYALNVRSGSESQLYAPQSAPIGEEDAPPPHASRVPLFLMLEAIRDGTTGRAAAPQSSASKSSASKSSASKSSASKSSASKSSASKSSASKSSASKSSASKSSASKSSASKSSASKSSASKSSASKSSASKSSASKASTSKASTSKASASNTNGH